MTIIFGSPEALEILKRDGEIKAKDNRIAALKAGPPTTLTRDEREQYRDIVADIIIADYEEQARADAEAMSDRALLVYIIDNDAGDVREDAQIILESRFSADTWIVENAG